MTAAESKPVFGFIGTGNMGSALARAVCRRVEGERVLLSNRTQAKAEALAAGLGCKALGDNQAVAARATYLFLGVKPQGMAPLLEELAPTLAAREGRLILVNMAAGLGIGDIQRMAGAKYPVILLKPNTPAAIGEGMTLYLSSPEVTPEEEAVFLDAMQASGRLAPLPENLMDIGGVLAGCGPAFVDMFLEALMTAGAARLVLESGKHPGQLKDEVCSPGGVTIQGVRKLEEKGLRSAVMEAVIAVYGKNEEMGKGST